MAELTVADLSAHHIGRKVRLTGPEGDVSGLLTQVWHQRGWGDEPLQNTRVVLDAGGGMTWNQAVKPTTPVTVELRHKGDPDA